MGVLVLLSLALITVSFRRARSTPLQGVGATSCVRSRSRAERVARPFRDAAGWAGDCSTPSPRTRSSRRSPTSAPGLANQSALQENDEPRQLAVRRLAELPAGLHVVATRVMAQPPSRFEQQIVIAAGTDHGIGLRDRWSRRRPRRQGDQSSAASRGDAADRRASAVSAARPRPAERDRHRPARAGRRRHLVLDRVDKAKFVNTGDVIVTAGSPVRRSFPSLYPRGIQIGVVTRSTRPTPTCTSRSRSSRSSTSRRSSRCIVLVPKRAGGAVTPAQGGRRCSSSAVIVQTASSPCSTSSAARRPAARDAGLPSRCCAARSSARSPASGPASCSTPRRSDARLHVAAADGRRLLDRPLRRDDRPGPRARAVPLRRSS